MADLNIGNSTANVIVNAKHNGMINPQINNTYDLGTSTLRWKNIYGNLKGNADTATTATNLASAGTWTWTNGTTAGPTASLVLGGKTTSIGAIPSASSSASGVITTGTQTIAGEKTFTSNLSIKRNTPNLYITDTNTGVDTYSIIRFGSTNASGTTNTNAAYIFLNGPQRTSDGGANLMTIRNNVGDLRLNNDVINTGKLTVGQATKNASYNFYVNGTSYFNGTQYIQSNSSSSTTNGLTINNGVLAITNYNQTLTVGPVNASHTHFLTTGSSFYFDKPVYIDGNLTKYNYSSAGYGTISGYNLDGNASTATKATQDSDGNAINTTYLKKRSMLETSVGNVTSGTSAGTQSVLRIYGPTYGNEASYLKTSGKFSYGDPGPQIQFSASASGGQQAALIYTDHDTIGDGISLSLVTNENDAWFIAPHIKALTGFVGNLSGNATTMSYPLGFSIRELNNWTNGEFVSNGFTTFVTDWAEPSGGSIYWASNSKGQLAAGIDGYFYQGRDVRDKQLHRCLDTYDLSNSKWGNSDKVDGYHASQLWRSDGGAWNPGANISLEASGNGQEWSFDIHRNGYTGCYWHVWDESRATMLKVTPDDGKVSAPYGFIGTLEGPAWYLSNTSHNISISKSGWGASNPWGCTNRTLVWGQRGYNGSYSSDSADIVLYYGNTGASGGAGWFLHIDGGIYSMGGVYGAVWNDYAEFRESTDEQPGRVVMEDSKGICQRTNERLQPFAGIISDTFGFSEGKTDKATTPLAVAGRVLAYPYQNRNNYKPGDCVCAAPNGTVDIMTREEVREWPDRIVGTVSEIPSYETWGTGNVEVNGRIWIKVK